MSGCMIPHCLDGGSAPVVNHHRFDARKSLQNSTESYKEEMLRRGRVVFAYFHPVFVIGSPMNDDGLDDDPAIADAVAAFLENEGSTMAAFSSPVQVLAATTT